MEHFPCAFTEAELSAERVLTNRRFLRTLERDLHGHPLYDHPLNQALAAGLHGTKGLRFVLTQMLKIIEPFTAMLGLLAGRAPDLKSRHVVFDNFYEEMGQGDLAQAHPMLWLRFLGSIGVSPAVAVAEPALCSIVHLNARMKEALLELPFPVACAWISFSELPVPNIFGHLARAVARTFAGVAIDRGFFDRHGPRDEGHAEDAHLLTSLHATPEDHPAIAREARQALDLRGAVWDEFQTRLKLLRPAAFPQPTRAGE
jgi:pyrroloquinoline quinone (PQQ) biosynthesis protein C